MREPYSQAGSCMYVECVRPLSNFVDVICMQDTIYGLLKRYVMYAETVRVIHKQKLPSVCTAKLFFRPTFHNQIS